MRVAICDDEMIYQEAISKAVEGWKKQKDISSVAVLCFRSSEELLRVWERQTQFDIVFLDIQIPNELSGLDLARYIRNSDTVMQIVFITNYEQYTFEGYNVNALRYIQKPFQNEQIYECLDIAYSQWQLLRGASITVRQRGTKIVLPYKDILYVESNGHNLLIRKAGDGSTISIRQNIDNISKMLPMDLFVQCHRSFIVNILYVRRFTHDTIALADGRDVPIGKKYCETFSGAFDHYYQGL